MARVTFERKFDSAIAVRIKNSYLFVLSSLPGSSKEDNFCCFFFLFIERNLVEFGGEEKFQIVAKMERSFFDSWNEILYDHNL